MSAYARKRRQAERERRRAEREAERRRERLDALRHLAAAPLAVLVLAAALLAPALFAAPDPRALSCVDPYDRQAVPL